MALGINQVAAIAGSFIGLVLGGVLGRVGLARGVLGERARSAIARHASGRTARCTSSAQPPRRRGSTGAGNITFAVGLTALLAAITYGIQPYGGHPTGWTNPWVLAGLVGGVVLLRRSASSRRGSPTRCSRCACSGSGRSRWATSPACSPSIGRGGLQFMLIIWLQGIWLPLHGYSYERRRCGPASTCCR